MGAITLESLMARVRERANMVNGGFIADAELISIINGEGADLYDQVIGAYADQFTTELQFSIASGNTYDIAPEMYELRGVDFQVGADWESLLKSQWNERNGGGGGGLFANMNRRCNGRRFRLVGSKLYITPKEIAVGTYRLWYVPDYVDLADPSDTLDYPSNWYEAVIAGSAAKCLAKEESDASIQLGLKAAAMKRIEGMAPNRDVSGPETIEFTRNRGRYDDWDDR